MEFFFQEINVCAHRYRYKVPINHSVLLRVSKAAL